MNQSRENLYQKWFEWVTANLGRDKELAGIAATAATEAIGAGGGFNTAAESARTAWAKAAANRGQDQAGPASRGVQRWWSWWSFGCGVVVGIVVGISVLIVWFVVTIGVAFGPGF